jgi:TPR repeat protein
VDFRACSAAANIYVEGLGVARDPARAAVLLAKSCVDGEVGTEAESCEALARMYDAGVGVERSTDRALGLYAGVCSFKDWKPGTWERDACRIVHERARSKRHEGLWR